MIARDSYDSNAFREALGKGVGDVLRTEKIVNLRSCSGKTHPRTACGTNIRIVCFFLIFSQWQNLVAFKTWCAAECVEDDVGHVDV